MEARNEAYAEQYARISARSQRQAMDWSLVLASQDIHPIIAGPNDQAEKEDWALLVAPVFSEKGEVEYYLPPGNWRNLLTGETASGGAWRCETHGYLSLPLWVSAERGAAWKCLKGFSG